MATSRSTRPVTGLRLVREGTLTAARGQSTPIRGPRDVFDFVRDFFAQEDVEVFAILALNAQHCVVGNAPIVITRGILNSSLVHAREVFRAAIVANAAAVILLHNHPSGDTTPSADDRSTTRQLVEAGRLLDMPVQDHLIIGDTRFTSLAEQGLL